MTAGRVALSLIAVLLMSAVARTAYTSLTEGDPGSILRYESELRTAEQTSARLTAEVTEVRASGRVRDGTISRIMSLIPSHLKEEHWLEQLTVSRPNPERPGTASFKFTGYSLDIADLLKATATLTESGAVLSASVAQTTKVRRPAVISNLISEDELDHFEVYGETR
jgi:hypothetical protein